MKNREQEVAQVEAVLDARDALSPENINKTALDYISRAFCTIRLCAHDEPRRAGIIADAFHNLPRVLQSWNHQSRRDEIVRAIHILNAPKLATTATKAPSTNHGNTPA
jgi:hypothetical protein